MLVMTNMASTGSRIHHNDITRLYVEKESLQARGLSLDDLMPLTYEDEDDDYEEKPSIRLVNSSELTEIIAEQDVLLNY